MRNIFLMICVCSALAANGQDSVQVSTMKKGTISASAYAEVYYNYDFSKPVDNNRPAFLYNHQRHNELNINLAMVKFSYINDRTRANLAWAAGTYINANYAAEPGTLKNFLEANVGYRLSEKSQLWLDLGILPSHIGFESAIGKDNWTLTRSIIAENSPYFETGAKLNYTTGDQRLTLSVLALNGWQRIARLPGNSIVSWGAQLLFKPNTALTLNYSSFIGSDKPDSIRPWRYYQNLYGIWQLNEKAGVSLGLDIGAEQKQKGKPGLNTWYSPVIIFKYAPNNQLAFAYRAEYFRDKNNVIITAAGSEDFEVTGHSVNIDYFANDNIMFRVEGRIFTSGNVVFIAGEKQGSHNNAITLCTAISI